MVVPAKIARLRFKTKNDAQRRDAADRLSLANAEMLRAIAEYQLAHAARLAVEPKRAAA
jgi:hypothetical protein